MHANDYKLMADHRLRHVLRSVTNGPEALPGKKQLRAELVEALPEAEPEVIDALMTKCQETAQRCVDRGERWNARAGMDELTLHVLKAYEASDRLVPLPNEDAVDPANVIDYIDEKQNGAFNTRKAATERAQSEFRRAAGLDD